MEQKIVQIEEKITINLFGKENELKGIKSTGKPFLEGLVKYRTDNLSKTETKNHFPNANEELADKLKEVQRTFHQKKTIDKATAYLHVIELV